MTEKAESRRLYLFEHYPALEAALPVVPIIDSPTPVQRLANVSQRLGREVWVKRDDLTSKAYGGNKPRKLEFILADALKSGKKKIVTGGGLGTNHGLATLVHSRKLGFSVRLILFSQPATPHVRQTLKLFHALGAGIHYAGGLVSVYLPHIRHRKAAPWRQLLRGTRRIQPAEHTGVRGCGF